MQLGLSAAVENLWVVRPRAVTDTENLLMVDGDHASCPAGLTMTSRNMKGVIRICIGK